MKIKYLLISTIAVLLTSFTFAGLTQPALVTIDADNMFAQGDMVTARYSKNDLEFIGCGIRAFDDGAGGAFNFGFCQANDTEGGEAFCNTENSDLLDVMKATSDYSFVTFSWNEDGECTRIGFSTQSFYLPNFKLKKVKKNDDDDDGDDDD